MVSSIKGGVATAANIAKQSVVITLSPKQVPAMLIAFRAIAGPIIIALAFSPSVYAGTWCSIVLALGVLSDIFDGIIARRYKVSTDNLRLWDSRVDVIFWLCVTVGVHILHPTLWPTTAIMVVVLGILETIPRIISHVRFQREASTHHILSKVFTLFLWALLTQLFLQGVVTPLFWVTLFMGIVSQCEAILIMLIVPHWVVDVKSVGAALSLRRAQN